MSGIMYHAVTSGIKSSLSGGSGGWGGGSGGGSGGSSKRKFDPVSFFLASVLVAAFGTPIGISIAAWIIENRNNEILDLINKSGFEESTKLMRNKLANAGFQAKDIVPGTVVADAETGKIYGLMSYSAINNNNTRCLGRYDATADKEYISQYNAAVEKFNESYKKYDNYVSLNSAKQQKDFHDTLDVIGSDKFLKKCKEAAADMSASLKMMIENSSKYNITPIGKAYKFNDNLLENVLLTNASFKSEVEEYNNKISKIESSIQKIENQWSKNKSDRKKLDGLKKELKGLKKYDMTTTIGEEYLSNNTVLLNVSPVSTNADGSAGKFDVDYLETTGNHIEYRQAKVVVDTKEFNGEIAEQYSDYVYGKFTDGDIKSFSQNDVSKKEEAKENIVGLRTEVKEINK